MFAGNNTEFYRALGLDKDATPDQVRNAFQAKISANLSAADQAKVKQAMDVLSDAKKKKVYDSMGANGMKMYDNLGPEKSLQIAETVEKYSGNKVDKDGNPDPNGPSCLSKFCFSLCFLLTGCCFCCCCWCCCCCCCGCCGKGKKEGECEEEGVVTGHSNPVVSEQPK